MTDESTLKVAARPDRDPGGSVPEHLHHFYFDPDIHEPIMRKALVELIGIDDFVYGDNLGGSDNFHGDPTDEIGLSEADRERSATETR